MRKTTFTALLATGFFVAGGVASADTLPEPGTQCTAREAAQTRHEGIELEDGRIVQCLKDEDNRRQWVWTVTFEPEVVEEDDTDESEEEDDTEVDDDGGGEDGSQDDEDGPGDDGGDTDTEDDPADVDEGSEDVEEGGEDEGTDAKPSPTPKPVHSGQDDEDEKVAVETVSGGSDTLPVTGGALTGLVLAALATLGLGGAATYLARKRNT